MRDLLSLLREKVEPAKIKKVSGRNGGEYHSPCPMCGGTDRFITFPEQDGGEICRQHSIRGTWSCPRGCNKGGDVITFLTEVHGMSFKDACAELEIAGDSTKMRAYRPLRRPSPSSGSSAPVFAPREYADPADIWKDQATKMSGEAHEALLKTPLILKWLAARGLPEKAVRTYRLGYLEAEGKNTDCLYRARSAFGLPEKQGKNGPVRALRIPRGVTIPAFGQDGRCCRIRIRRRDIDLDPANPKDPKYLLVPQPSNPYSAPLALKPCGVTEALATWVVVEAELDAMAVHHACGGAVGALSVLSVSGKPDVIAHRLLSRSVRILVALDFDTDKADGSNPGASAWPWWEQTYPQARLWPVPEGKDPGEAFRLGVDLREWIAAGTPLRHNPEPSGAQKKDALTPVAAAQDGRLGKNFESLPVVEKWAWTGRDVDELTHPAGPDDSLRVLARAGLRVEKADDDFVIYGQSTWSHNDQMRLFDWARWHGDWVKQALYGAEVSDDEY